MVMVIGHNRWGYQSIRLAAAWRPRKWPSRRQRSGAHKARAQPNINRARERIGKQVDAYSCPRFRRWHAMSNSPVMIDALEGFMARRRRGLAFPAAIERQFETDT